MPTPALRLTTSEEDAARIAEAVARVAEALARELTLQANAGEPTDSDSGTTSSDSILADPISPEPATWPGDRDHFPLRRASKRASPREPGVDAGEVRAKWPTTPPEVTGRTRPGNGLELSGENNATFPGVGRVHPQSTPSRSPFGCASLADVKDRAVVFAPLARMDRRRPARATSS